MLSFTSEALYALPKRYCAGMRRDLEGWTAAMWSHKLDRPPLHAAAPQLRCWVRWWHACSGDWRRYKTWQPSRVYKEGPRGRCQARISASASVRLTCNLHSACVEDIRAFSSFLADITCFAYNTSLLVALDRCNAGSRERRLLIPPEATFRQISSSGHKNHTHAQSSPQELPLLKQAWRYAGLIFKILMMRTKLIICKTCHLMGEPSQKWWRLLFPRGEAQKCKELWAGWPWLPASQQQ